MITKLISYWGNVDHYTKLLSIIINGTIVDVERHTLLQSFSKGMNSDILFYMLCIPIVKEYLLEHHKDVIVKCLEQSANWNLYMCLCYTHQNEQICINSEIATKIKADIEESKYIFNCVMNDEFDNDMETFKLGSQLFFSPRNDIRFPYYSEAKYDCDIGTWCWCF